MGWLYFILRNWRWVVGIATFVIAVATTIVLKTELAIARHQAAAAQADLAAERLQSAKAVSEAKKQSLETQDRAAELVQNSAKTFDEKLQAIRARYAAKPRNDAHPAGQPSGVQHDAPAPGGSVSEVTGAPGQPDGSTPDSGTRPLDERCAETTQQLLDLQEYVRNVQKLYNAR